LPRPPSARPRDPRPRRTAPPAPRARAPEGTRFEKETGDGAFRADEVVFGSARHRNLGRGRFVETSDATGVEQRWPGGVAVADFNRDGLEDGFLPSGRGGPFADCRSPLQCNRGNGTSDLDGDGRFGLAGNAFNGRTILLMILLMILFMILFMNLFMNPSPDRPGVGMRLVGPKGQRAAIGALVRVRVGARTFVRRVHAAGGDLAPSSNTPQVGPGTAAGAMAVEVRWPDGAVRAVGALERGRVHVFRHPGARPRPAAPPHARLDDGPHRRFAGLARKSWEASGP